MWIYPGITIRTIAKTDFSPGVYPIQWDGTSDSGKRVPTGCYILSVGTDTSTLAVSLPSFADFASELNAVPVGPVIIGGGHAPVIQTMTNTETTDIASTSQQIIDVWEHGAEIVRLQVPLMRAAKHSHLFGKQSLRLTGIYHLVADIHFSPDIAYAALPHVDKIRINPVIFLNRAITKDDHWRGFKAYGHGATRFAFPGENNPEKRYESA